jgi:hypothetical protein
VSRRKEAPMTSKAHAKPAPKKLPFREETLRDLSLSRIDVLGGTGRIVIRETVLVIPTRVGNPSAGVPSIDIRNR